MNDVLLAIEGNKESYIQEIGLDGRETWIQPLSMSEKLQRATQKIDFFKELEGDDETKEGVKEEPQENPWDSVRKNIVDALTEVRVLHDVLAVLRLIKQFFSIKNIFLHTHFSRFFVNFRAFFFNFCQNILVRFFKRYFISVRLLETGTYDIFEIFTENYRFFDKKHRQLLVKNRESKKPALQ